MYVHNYRAYITGPDEDYEICVTAADKDTAWEKALDNIPCDCDVEAVEREDEDPYAY